MKIPAKKHLCHNCGKSGWYVPKSYTKEENKDFFRQHVFVCRFCGVRLK